MKINWIKNFISILLSISVLLILQFTSCTYPSDGNLLEDYDPNVMTVKNEGTTIAVIPNAKCQDAFVFYPGANVSYQSYLPLMIEIAKYNVACFLVQMPLNLAMYDTTAADELIEAHTEFSNWYVGGHSLGGAMASYFANICSQKIKGLVLTAAYSSYDISKTGIKVFSIYGSEDKVLNKNNYEKNKKNLPLNFTEYVVEGGNHSGFAYYGPQKNDGDATITKKEQIQISALKISDFITN